MKILYNIRLAAVHDGKSTQEIVDAVIETANRHIEGLMSEVQDYVGELNKLIDEPKAEMQKRIRELEAEVERKETFAREEAARRFDAEERIRELEAKVDDLQTIRDNTPDWSNGYSAAWKEQEKAIVELRAERDLLRWKLKQFKVWGADDCATCDEGRVTLFVANTRCMTCDPEAYKVPEQLASKGGTEGTEGTDG
jgi:DNA repair exonuclease SbcCD ATPase subunit